MGFKIKNSLTGEFEKLPILTLKGEKGETGGVEEYNKVDYMGNKYETLKQANDANVEYAVKTAIGEFNYLDYDGQHITATDTIEGRSKSAILKGQTLVNLVDYGTVNNSNNYTIIKNNDVITITSQTSKPWLRASYNLNITHDKKYIMMWDSLEYTQTSSNGINNLIGIWGHSDDGGQYEVKAIKQGQTNNYLIFSIPNTSPINLSKTTVRIHATTDVAENGATTTVKGLKVIEYQEGMENWDIPYFEGMTSVKAPVLESVGKNLYSNGDLTINNPKTNQWYYTNGVGSRFGAHCKRGDGGNWFYLAKGTYTYKATTKNTLTNIVLIGEGETVHPSGQEVKSGWYIFRFKTGAESVDYVKVLNLQLEKGSTSTTYEPYKSNTLSTPEDLELRGIGNVKDELNVATGELTQRIGESVYKGDDTEYWFYSIDVNDDLIEFARSVSDVNTIIACDRLPISGTTERFVYASNKFYVRLLKSRLATQDIAGFKQWLSQNPITIQYELKTPVVKTVDLSDNHVYSYKDMTHYDCSSAEGSLVPTLSVKVPTDVQATIAQQRETIQTLNSENERLNQIQEALKASMLDSQVQLMNLSWNTDFEVFTLRESIAPKDFLLDSRTGSNIDKFSQAKFIIENDCPDLEKLNSQIEYYFSKDVFSQEQFEELTDLISIVKGENGCEY